MSTLLQDVLFEIIPLKSADAAIAALPPSSHVSVTCSPVKGIAATLELSERVLAAGHVPVPHIAARMVDSVAQVTRLAAWCRNHGVRELFVVGGDQEVPLGPFRDGLDLIKALLEVEHGLETIGFTAYPDGHALIDRAVLHEVTHAKEALVLSAGLRPFVSTQMCFDVALLRKWLEGERAAGLKSPVHLGVPGAIDRTRLLTMGARLGIGASLRYLKKNRSTMGKLLAPGGYDPMSLVRPLEGDAGRLGITALHLFTFNEVEATEAWREQELSAPLAAAR